jgi:PAS domain S-box-containing protein
VVAGSFDGILILDRRGRVTDCNPAGEAMFGFSLAEIKGHDAGEILFPPSHQRPDLLSSSLGQRVELMGMRADGTEFPIELTVSELRRRQDRLLCVSIRDLTDRMRAEQSKRESDAKSRFLSTMSHELRTPLNSILGFAQLAEPLAASHSNDRLSVYVNNILVSGWHLLTLINDVLDFSRVQSGLLKLTPRMVVLSELVDSAAAKMEPIADTAGVEVSFDVDPALALAVDPVRLEQVLLNLLTNAVKFTSTKVWLQASRSGSGVAISVRDDGDGIAAELQESVFEDFVQLESGSTRAYDGAGLGLPISRRLVEAMGGTVLLESRAGGGATFTVWLPAYGSNDEAAS